jgi:hypothetical protein
MNIVRAFLAAMAYLDVATSLLLGLETYGKVYASSRSRFLSLVLLRGPIPILLGIYCLNESYAVSSCYY